MGSSRVGTHDGERKNAKSAICAVLALGHLVGPLRTDGWRGAVASGLAKRRRAELRNQVRGR